MKDDTTLPVMAAVAGLISVQVGAAFAKSLFPLVGTDGLAALRVGIAAVGLALVLRPWTLLATKVDRVALLGYGVTLGLMNLLIYRAFAHIPVGVAISIEVLGPLAVAVLASRQRLDLVWAACALLGLALLPLGAVAGSLDWRGIALALAAAACWAGYVSFGARVAGLGRRAVAAGLAIASVIVVPLGIIEAGNALLEPAILALGVVVAMLSSVLPFLFDIYALKRLPRSVFGVLMSAAPAVAALAGVIVLGEMLGPLQWIGIAAITFACAGSAVVISRRPTTSMVNDVTEWID